MAKPINLLWIATDEADSAPGLEALEASGLEVSVRRMGVGQVGEASAEALLAHDAAIIEDAEPRSMVEGVLGAVARRCQGALKVVVALTGEDFSRATALMDRGAYRCLPRSQPDLIAHAIRQAAQGRNQRWHDHMTAAERLEVDSATLFRRAFEHSPVGIVVGSGDAGAVLSNPAFEQLLGYTNQELRTQTFLFSTLPEHIEHHKKLVNEVLSGQRDGFTLEQRFIRKDGSTLWGRLNVVAVRGADGKVAYSITSLADLSDRKQAEDELRKTQQQLERLVSASPVVVSSFSVEPPNRLIFISENVERVLGYPIKSFEVGYDFWMRYVHPDDMSRVQDQWGVLAKHDEIHLEYRLLHGDGTYHWFSISGSLLRDEAGIPVEIAGTIFDITERKLAEERLRASEERYRTLAEAAPDLVVVLDRKGVIRYCNGLLLQMIGLPAGEVLGKDYHLLLPEGLTPEQEVYIQKVFATGEKYSGEGQIILPTGTTWVSSLIVPFTKEGDTVTEVLAVMRDITSRIAMENQIREAYEREKKLNAQKSTFVRKASHEIRTPLSVILSSAELLEHYGKTYPDEKRQHHFHRIKRSVQELNLRLEQILEIEKAGAGMIACNPEPVELVSFFSDLGDEARLLDQNRRDLRLILPEEESPAVVDKKLLRQAIMNLLSNAFKYSSAETPVVLTLAVEGETFAVEVRDHGIGILPEDMPHIYEESFRGRNVGSLPGHGLGMVVVRDSVEVMGGSINIHSEPGAGTVFRLSLPLQQKPGLFQVAHGEL